MLGGLKFATAVVTCVQKRTCVCLCETYLTMARQVTRRATRCAADMTRFWIMSLQGRKLVRLLPPSEFARAHASDNASYCPTLFSVDLMDPDFERFPEADGMLVYEALLNPGDVLFIPEGWGHKCVPKSTDLSSAVAHVHGQRCCTPSATDLRWPGIGL